MSPGTLARLAVAGNRTDLARMVLTALSAALATLVVLAALTVLAIEKPPGPEGTQSEQYTNALLREPGLRGGTAFALLLLTIPVLALAGQCARLGAPARDRRLAALRLAGATPGQVTRLAALETGLASLLGALAGLAGYLVGRTLLHRPDGDGRLALPTDVLPAVPALAVVVLALPAIAALATAVMLRGVTTTPLGVVRRAGRTGAPRPWPALLVGLGVLAAALFEPVRESLGPALDAWLALVVLVVAISAVLGVVLGTGTISYLVGRLLHRYASSPARLLAARRLTDDPWAGSRTFAALLAALVFGAGAAAFRAWFQLRDQLEREQNQVAGFADFQPDSFYLRTMDLVDLAVALAVTVAAAGLIVMVVEGISTRRRAYAALVATGVPRTTIGTSILWQVLAPVVPAVLSALGAGYVIGRMLMGDIASGGRTEEVCRASAELCQDPVARQNYVEFVQVDQVVSAPGVPLGQLALLGGGAVVAVLATVGVGLLFLRSNTAVEELRAT
ncbi:FtsX-like permease family protein [Micromonospora zingiberis]|uniref:FtsX-like permease family protein n=1 Tax=Micromonospora zingiberis TaxID=2053011 RepID=A0A4R0GD38_9ACTN|nr:FtsX-like permease family protein [Micromonospora zingiberis]TCB94407.1 FtsX-like permease family protein [Micromonospora zingiberis]